MTTPDYKLGAAEARIDVLNEKVDDLKQTVEQMQREIHQLTLTLAKVEGAWKFAVRAAAIASGIISFIAGIIVEMLIK